MTSVADASAALAGSGLPLLLIDTCTLLDLAREPTREKFNADQARAAIHLLEKAEGAEIGFHIAQQSLGELQQHIAHIAAEGDAAVARFDDNIDKVLGILSAYGIAEVPLVPNLAALQFGNAARSVIDRFTGVATVVDQDAGALERAFARVKAGIAPATKSRQSMKDCLIIETHLETVRLARAAAFSGPIVFISSNTNDYCDPSKPNVRHPDFDGEWDQLQVQFARSFLEARYTFFHDQVN